MAKARMHWFWRGTIALQIGGIGAIAVAFLCAMVSRSLNASFSALYVAAAMLVPLPGVMTYGLLTRRFGPPPPDGELHCRRCNHILRGLSEPRCPECGEKI